MAEFWTTFVSTELSRIVALSLGVSLSATTLAILIGLPLGASLAVFRFPGRRLLIIVVNALLGLPPVVVGPDDDQDAVRETVRAQMQLALDELAGDARR